MPLIRPFFTSSAPLALALAVQADATALLLWAKSQGRFPERDVAALPAHRQLEHYAVDVVLKRMGWEAHQMQIVHDAQRKPIIQSEDVGMAQQAIAIAHSTEEGLCHALVTIGSGAIGCDIEGEREALRTVAHRVLSPDEGTAESSPISPLCFVDHQRIHVQSVRSRVGFQTRSSRRVADHLGS